VPVPALFQAEPWQAELWQAELWQAEPWEFGPTADSGACSPLEPAL